MEIYRRVEEIVRNTLNACVERGDLTVETLPDEVPVEKPKDPSHGDFATSICLRLAKPARRNPREIARAFLTHLADPDTILESAEMAGPGFINFRVRRDVWLEAFKDIARSGGDYGRSDVGKGRKVLVEFVSANPTGPLHVGHGRGAVIGDTVAALLDATGWDVDREYYVNDVGNQMNILGRSLFLRYQELCGREIEIPEDFYKGDYVGEIAAQFREEHGDAYVDHDYESEREPFKGYIKDVVLGFISKDLERLGVRYDTWFSEQSLHDAGEIHAAINKLRMSGHVYNDEDGKTWFKTSEFFEDEDDRVVIRDTGVPTYFAADIAYHNNKFERGYDHCINVWGADHHGYIPRMKAVVQALGYEPDRLELLLYQFVSLVEDGQQVRMSTRGGTFETLGDLLEDVGEDVTRCNFVMRKSDSQFDFDLKLAKTQSLDNPVFSVQYGHARIARILGKALEEGGHTVPNVNDVDLAPLVLPEELDLIKRALDYPWTIRSAAEARAPHHIIFYLQELIGKFHSYYTQYAHTDKVISDDLAKTAARLFLCGSLRIVLANALHILGVSAPDRMYFSQ